jgi:hypothetical protein
MKISWNLEKRNINDLIPHEKNPRIFTEKGLKDLEKSFKKIGMAQPININQDGTILSGHARITKLKELGETEIDVYVPSKALSEKEQEEVLIRMNANTAGQWDYDKLANEFELPELNEWGLEIPDSPSLSDEFGEEFALPDGDKAPFQQMTFTLADQQAEKIKEALAEVKKTDGYKYTETMGNENSNGNALYSIITQWAEQRK